MPCAMLCFLLVSFSPQIPQRTRTHARNSLQEDEVASKQYWNAMILRVEESSAAAECSHPAHNRKDSLVGAPALNLLSIKPEVAHKVIRMELAAPLHHSAFNFSLLHLRVAMIASVHTCEMSMQGL